MNKVCTKCGKFEHHNIKKNGVFQSQCKFCQNKASKAHYRANKQKYIARARAVVYKLKIKLVGYLKCHPCVDCGESDAVVLDFDHVRGKKRCAVSRLITRGSWKSIEKEIAKCDVRCANCHRRKTFGRNKKFLDL